MKDVRFKYGSLGSYTIHMIHNVIAVNGDELLSKAHNDEVHGRKRDSHAFHHSAPG